MTELMPAVFVGHGSPMNALSGSPYAAGWRAMGERLPRPRAILAISAHWTTEGVAVTAQAHPPTIHDFRGFPQALFDMRYPAPGAVDLAAKIGALLDPEPVLASERWGYDHGAWSVLTHMYPKADIPLAQLSLNLRLSPLEHYSLAEQLRPLREDGVMIIGSGDIVHNLRAMHQGPAHPWAERFETKIKAAIIRNDIETAAALEADEDARLSVPDHEHYWPVLYVAAQRYGDEPIQFFNEGIDFGAISMTSFIVGEAF